MVDWCAVGLLSTHAKRCEGVGSKDSTNQEQEKMKDFTMVVRRTDMMRIIPFLHDSSGIESFSHTSVLH